MLSVFGGNNWGGRVYSRGKYGWWLIDPSCHRDDKRRMCVRKAESGWDEGR